MPRPGQPGAMQFDGKNITDFLDEWNIECEDFGLTPAQRCVRFPFYCIPDIKETVKLLSGYIANDWDVLQNEVKQLYWPHDKPKNTMAALDKLVKEAPIMDLDVYVLKYTSISNALVTAHALSSLDRVSRLLDGLSEDLRRRVIRYCTKKGWKLSAHDVDKKDPDYKEITDFILTEARTDQTMTVFDKERALRERSEINSDLLTVPTSLPNASTKTSSMVLTAPTTSIPTPMETKIEELTNRVSHFTLLLETNLKPGVANIPRPVEYLKV